MLPPKLPCLIVIVGPTASGKSGLALALADRLQTVILSADSRQVYREFDIGTAKPTPAEQQQIGHYLIDCCDPIVALTVADYQHQANALIQTLHDRAPQTPPLLVGGTGLYIRAIVRGMRIPRVPPQPELRAQLEQLGQSFCYQLLQQVDAASASKIHAHDPVRTLRALEVFYATGQPISALQGEAPPSYPILQIGLDCANRDRLRAKIRQRTYEMIERGLVAEVAALCEKYGPHLPLLNTLGYQEIRQYLAGDCSLNQAIEAIVLHTSQFAKRQRTWFRADPEIHWFDSDRPDLLDLVYQQVQEFC